MNGTRFGRYAIGAAILSAAAGVAIGLMPASANAAIIPLPAGPTTLHPGDQVCVGASATSDAKGSGTANNPGVVYIMSKGGTELFRTDTRRTGPFATKVFTGAGSYLFCAKNATGLGTDVTGVNIRLLTDGDA